MVIDHGFADQKTGSFTKVFSFFFELAAGRPVDERTTPAAQVTRPARAAIVRFDLTALILRQSIVIQVIQARVGKIGIQRTQVGEVTLTSVK